MTIVARVKRKSATLGSDGGRTAKRAKTATKVPGNAHSGGHPVRHALLSRLYPNLFTLREYVLAKLPPSSRLRRKKIASIGRQDARPGNSSHPSPDVEAALGHLLDTTLVGSYNKPPAQSDNRWEQWANFSQKGDDSYVTLTDGSAGALFSQREVCLKRRYPTSLLCPPNKRGRLSTL